MERGQDYGLGLAGYFAMRSLRVEKFYAFWGQDLGTTTTPLECGRGFRVKFNVRAGAGQGRAGEAGLYVYDFEIILCLMMLVRYWGFP